MRYLAGYIAASRLRSGSEIILEKGPWGDSKAIVFPTREKAAKAARKHGYEYTRGYVYETSNPKNAKRLTPLDEASDVG